MSPKISIISAMILIANITAASAADMAAARVMPAKPEFKWSGPYIGVETGVPISRFTHKSDSTANIEERLGHPSRVPMLGLYAGYNFELPKHFIFGIDANIDRYSSKVLRIIPDSLYMIYKETAVASARARLGLAQGRFMPYVAAGLSVLRAVDFAASQSLGINSGEKAMHNFTGWNLGTGIDYAATSNLLLRADYRFNTTLINDSYYMYKPDVFLRSAATTRGVKSHQIRVGAAYKF